MNEKQLNQDMTQRRALGSSNMELWKQVAQTNPDVTKAVSMRGGFTAICPQSQIKRATEVLGIYGIGWGVDFKSEEYIRNGSGEIIEYVYRGQLWFMWGAYGDDGKGLGQISCSASMKYKPGDDVQIKCETHARSKALSKLGFNSDVYEGLFDDHEYIDRIRQEKVDQPVIMPHEIEEHQLSLEHLRMTCRQHKIATAKIEQFMGQWMTKYDVSNIEELTAEQVNECAFQLDKLYKNGEE